MSKGTLQQYTRKVKFFKYITLDFLYTLFHIQYLTHTFFFSHLSCLGYLQNQILVKTTNVGNLFPGRR